MLMNNAPLSTVNDPRLSPSVSVQSATSAKLVTIERSYIQTALLARPLERKLAFTSVALAAIVAFFMLVREFWIGSIDIQLVAILTATCIGTALATAIAIPKEDPTFCPVWEPLVYLLLIASIVLVPLIGRWASMQGFGLFPAMLPSLAWFTCVIAPFAVSNQSAFGLGSAVPKCVVMAAAVRYSTSGDWGIFSAGLLTTPHTAMVALACFSALTSAALIFVRKTKPNALMIVLGMVLTFPGIVLTEKALIALNMA